MTLKWTFFPVREFAAHQDPWQEINLAGSASPLLSARFVAPLIEQFSDGDELIAVCSRAGTAVAMTILRKSGRGIWETFQPAQAQVGMLVKRASISIEDLLRSLISSISGIPLMIGVYQQDPDLIPRPAESENVSTLDFIHTARVLINRSFDEYWKARDGKLRQETNRRLKRVHAIGSGPRLELVTDAAAVALGIVDFGNLESAGWKGREGTAVHAGNKQGEFYRSLLVAFCGIGKGRIYRYWIGDSLAAMQLCIAEDRTLVFLKTTYSENLKTHGPGILMQYAIMKELFAEGAFDKVEFYGKSGEPQTKWCDNQIRTMYHLNYYRWQWLAKMLALRHSVSRRLDSISGAGDDEQVDSIAERGRTYAVTVYDNLSALPRRHQELFARADNTNLYFTLPWYRNFIQSGLTPDARLRIYAVDAAGGPGGACAVLPMHYRDRGAGWLGARTLSGLSNYYASLFGPVIARGESDEQQMLDSLAAAIAGDEIRWDVIDLHPLDFDTMMFPALKKAFGNAGLKVQDYFCFGNWYLQVRGRSYAEYYVTLPSQLKNTVKRKKKRFEKSPNSSIVVYRDEAGLDKAMRAYEQIYASSWKIPEPFPGFIRGLCRACADSGWLRLAVAYVDDQPAAAQIWIVVGGIANIYKLAYDERFAKLSLGTVLTAHLMEHVIDVDKVHEVDYLTGDDAYKKDWMSHRRERWGIVAFNLRTPNGLLAAARHLGARAARRVLDAVRRRAQV